jgi:hypothetical protein
VGHNWVGLKQRRHNDSTCKDCRNDRYSNCSGGSVAAKNTNSVPGAAYGPHSKAWT